MIRVCIILLSVVSLTLSGEEASRYKFAEGIQESRIFNSEYHRFIQSIKKEDLDDKKLVEFLFQNIDWKIDAKTIPSGMKYPLWYPYTIAGQLKLHLDHKNVREGLWVYLGKCSQLDKKDEKFLLICWLATRSKFRIEHRLKVLAESVGKGEFLINEIIKK